MNTETPTLPTLVLPFEEGYKHYNKLVLLIGEHKAQLALRRGMEVSARFSTLALQNFQTIACSPYLNPRQMESVEFAITAACMEMLKTMYEGHCISSESNAAWEFVAVVPGRLLVRPPNLLAAHAHPWLYHS